MFQRTRQKRRAAERGHIDRSVTALAKESASPAPSLSQWYAPSASGKNLPLACTPWYSLHAPLPPPLHHGAARDATPITSRSRFAGG